MIVKSYYQTGACKPLWNQNCVVVTNEEGEHRPAIFLQRPKWITDDARWNILCKSVRLELPSGCELK